MDASEWDITVICECKLADIIEGICSFHITSDELFAFDRTIHDYCISS